MKQEIPELPEPAGRTYHDNALGEEVGPPSDWFHTDQLQAYGAACAAHAREVALSEAKEVILNFQAGWVPDGFTECADRIEALKKAGK